MSCFHHQHERRAVLAPRCRAVHEAVGRCALVSGHDGDHVKEVDRNDCAHWSTRYTDHPQPEAEPWKSAWNKAVWGT